MKFFLPNNKVDGIFWGGYTGKGRNNFCFIKKKMIFFLEGYIDHHIIIIPLRLR